MITHLLHPCAALAAHAAGVTVKTIMINNEARSFGVQVRADGARALTAGSWRLLYLSSPAGGEWNFNRLPYLQAKNYP
eukprot:1189762-Prorocentrum_minimum.AAC.3